MAAQYWLETMDKIFSVVACSEEEKVIYATHMLHEEAGFWWREAKAYLTAKEVPLTWENFQQAFLDMYVPEHVRRQKNREFVEFKQGNLSIVEYAKRFAELTRYSTEGKLAQDEKWKIE